MIARLYPASKYASPVLNPSEFRTESDVEQKFIYPFLTNVGFLGLPPEWIRTKDYMSPTEIDKGANKKSGYYPDYSIWVSGLPIVIVEAKPTDVSVETAVREARLYAIEINKRYPPGINPIRFIVGCNGEQISISEWDSEISTLDINCVDLSPGTTSFVALQAAIGRPSLEHYARETANQFNTRAFYSTSSFMGGTSRINQLLGVNEFAEPLFPTLTKYFGSSADETPDDVIDRAYVTSDELGRYEGILETYLKDRVSHIAGNQLKAIETSKSQATGISTEIQKFAGNPTFYSRVQLIIGSVGSGKSTFIRRYYRQLRSSQVRERTRWAFINFNSMPPDQGLQDWIAKSFISSFSQTNNVDIDSYEQITKILAPEIARFERGPNKPLRTADPTEFQRRRSSFLDELIRNPTEFARCIARHFSGDRGLGIVIVFDNVDKRSRDLQLAIFEAAQWFKELTRALILVNLRDSTFQAHRDEPPLDAFANAINFYIHPPRFSQVIRKRLELVLDVLPNEVTPRQQYHLSTGYRIMYPSSRLGEFLMTIYVSLFDQKSVKVASALEALVAKDVRRALGMFADIIVSPHIPTTEITGTVLTSGISRIAEFRVIRSLMRQRYRFYNGKSSYIRNILDANIEHERPSNLLYVDILEYLIRNRKKKVDFSQEGYITVETIQKRLGSAGYVEGDVFSAVSTLCQWGLVEPDRLIIETLDPHDAVRVHATGFIHMRFFLERLEYLVGSTTDMHFVSRDLAEEIGRIWAGQHHPTELPRGSQLRIMQRLKEYFDQEYQRRCNRHAFYADFGLGGRAVVTAMARASNHAADDGH